MNRDLDHLRQNIKQDRFHSVYLFYGPEEFLKERAVQEILAKMITPDLKEFNLDVLYGDETDAATIVDRAASLPMMAERRVVLVRNVNDLPAEERRKILEYSTSSEKRRCLDTLERDIRKIEKQLQDREEKADSGRKDATGPHAGSQRKDLFRQRNDLVEKKTSILKDLDFAFPHTCLLLTAARGDVTRLFHRGEKKIPSTDEPWLNVFADRTVAGIEFKTPPEKDIRARVSRLARDHGKSIAPRAVRMLVQAIGNDLLALDNELAKLSIYVADRPEIVPRDVEMVVGEMKARTVWELCSAVLSGNAARSFSVLGRLLESGIAVPQLTGAVRSRLHRLVPGGGGGSSGPRSGASPERIEKAYELLYETELSFLTGRRSAPLAMTLMVDQLCHLFSSPESAVHRRRRS